MCRRRRSVIVLASVALAACGAGEAASTPGPPSTVGNVGRLPGELSDGTSPAPTATESGGAPYVTTAGNDADDIMPPIPGRVGDVADGNDLLVLGDSILEATTTAYGGEMCERLVPHGWAVETDAENGRDAAAGLEVLRDRLDDGGQWDAAVVMLGNNYRNDREQFDQQLEEILDLLSPAPVVLLTVTEFEDSRAEVNEVIRTEAAERVNVRVLDWAARTAHDDSLVGEDGLHLSQDGRVALVAMIRLALGDAPLGSFGQCRDS
jgi:lysophospholipase L1-like esterase